MRKISYFKGISGRTEKWIDGMKSSKKREMKLDIKRRLVEQVRRVEEGENR